MAALSFLLPPQVQVLFSELYGEVFNVQSPGKEERRKFFEDLLVPQAAKPAAAQKKAGEAILQTQLCYL